VRKVEQQLNIGHGTEGHGRTQRGVQSRLIIAKAAMTADDTGYTCKYLEADGTEGGSITCRRANGTAVSDGDVGLLTLDSSGQYVFFLKDVQTAALWQPGSMSVKKVTGASNRAVYFDESYNGSWSTDFDNWTVWKFTSAVSVASGESLLVMVYGCGQGAMIETTGSGGFDTVVGTAYFKTATQDFTLATVTKAQFAALTGKTETVQASYDPDTGGSGGGGENDMPTPYWMKHDNSDGGTVYGFALWIDSITQSNAASNGDTRAMWLATTGTDVTIGGYAVLTPDTATSK
jgi:hypothetical protein